MTSFTPFSGPYLRVQRTFPTENTVDLGRQIEQAYLDIAKNVNYRIIGLYGINLTFPTGELWYFTGADSQQQSFRQIYTFTTPAFYPFLIPHNINPLTISMVSPRSYGVYTGGGGFWYGMIFSSSVGVAGNISFYVTPTNIVVNSGVGAGVLLSGTIILEWLTEVGPDTMG